METDSGLLRVVRTRDKDKKGKRNSQKGNGIASDRIESGGDDILDNVIG